MERPALTWLDWREQITTDQAEYKYNRLSPSNTANKRIGNKIYRKRRISMGSENLAQVMIAHTPVRVA